MKTNYILFNKSTYSYLLFSFVLLASLNANAQTINFTIDDATDNTIVITETISNGGNTYVLTVSHPGEETLFDLGGGDLVFYLGSGGTNASQPFNISVTKNGNPTNFKLNSIDWDTVATGSIAITNQDDAEISANTTYPIGSGPIVFTNTANAANITAFKIIPATINELNDFAFHNISIDVLDTLSTEKFTLENAFSVYPNPSHGTIVIGNSGVALDNVQLSDLNGRVLLNYTFNGLTESKTLHLGPVLSSGVYLMTLTSNSTSIIKKLIIK